MVLNSRRVKAAASSMSQFYPHVRGLIGGAVEDRFVEAATIYLYHMVSREVFGRHFADRVVNRAAAGLKHCTPDDALASLGQIAAMVTAFNRAPDPLLEPGAVVTMYEHFMRSVIRALLVAAGPGADDPEIVRSRFVPLERVLEKLRAHLRGIKKQNAMLLS